MKTLRAIKQVFHDWRIKRAAQRLRNQLIWFGLVGAEDLTDAEIQQRANQTVRIICNLGMTTKEAATALRTLLEAVNENTGT